MLVVHPSSHCDVCLDSYNWLTIEKTPHAIPCGHIFCKTCLETLHPTVCPLCRKAFLSSRVKKLHMDPPDNLDSDRDQELIEKIIMAWDAQEDELLELSTEVDAWLTGRDDASSTHLRKAREAHAEYHTLKTHKEQDRTTIKQLERTLRHKEQTAAYDRDNHHAVEQSLITQVEELQLQIHESQQEIEALKSELDLRLYSPSGTGKGKGKMRDPNPLPVPPEPVPMARLPEFVREAIVPEPGPSAIPGAPFIPPLLSADPHANHSSDNLPSAPTSVENWNNAILRMKQARAASSSAPQPANPLDSDLVEPAKRNGILKGASPMKRVVYPVASNNNEPPIASSSNTDPYLSERTANDYDPSRVTTAAEFVSGYGQAYERAYAVASRLGLASANGFRDSASSLYTNATYPYSSSFSSLLPTTALPATASAAPDLGAQGSTTNLQQVRPRFVSFGNPPPTARTDVLGDLQEREESRHQSFISAASLNTPRSRNSLHSRGTSESWGTPRSVPATEAGSDAWFDDLAGFGTPTADGPRRRSAYSEVSISDGVNFLSAAPTSQTTIQPSRIQSQTNGHASRFRDTSLYIDVAVPSPSLGLTSAVVTGESQTATDSPATAQLRSQLHTLLGDTGRPRSPSVGALPNVPSGVGSRHTFSRTISDSVPPVSQSGITSRVIQQQSSTAPRGSRNRPPASRRRHSEMPRTRDVAVVDDRDEEPPSSAPATAINAPVHSGASGSRGNHHARSATRSNHDSGHATAEFSRTVSSIYAPPLPMASAGNALGLNLNSDHVLPSTRTPTLVAPTPIFSSQAFLRSYSHDTVSAGSGSRERRF